MNDHDWTAKISTGALALLYGCWNLLLLIVGHGHGSDTSLDSYQQRQLTPLLVWLLIFTLLGLAIWGAVTLLCH